MNNALALISVTDTMTVAEQLVRSGFLPQSIKNIQQAFAIITLGQELGLTPWASINGINVIQGKPTVSPQTMLGMINRSGLLDDMSVDDGDTYSAVTMRRKGRAPYTFTFTDADATAMGLLGKDNWRKQKATMRRWRAINGCARIVFPDIINGMYPPEEIAPDLAVNEDGELVVRQLPEQTAAPAPSHLDVWTKDQRKAWVAALQDRNWHIDQIKEALGVDLVINFNGTEAEADAALDAAVARWTADAVNELDETSQEAYQAADEPAASDEPLSADDATQLTKWAKSTHKMTYQALCSALGIDNLLHYTGSYDDAVDAVDAVNAARKAVTA